ncbi:aminoglycoside phosphotransferase [Marinomonas piezotolerans]|uniref:Aminoglycoside phosphotransferase n=1 Tax=Marinomonas piezotolerans TaxID=2213058 RepID=A0A370U9T6_9GAMM|nr:phosphotransferase [Marinomonas piezotolerans]RDL44549.1 aminoglycoside phosphotransferase [Marinomonas piezotolerans]
MNKQDTEAQIGIEIQSFLQGLGISLNLVQPLPSDASARRYYRLADKGRMLMQEVPGSKDFNQYLIVAEHLFRLGFSVPQVFAVDHSNNLALIEDFGDMTYTRAFAKGHSESDLYALAIDTILALHAHSEATDVNLPEYDEPLLMEELTVFSQWFAPYVQPNIDVAEFEQRFLSFWQAPIKSVSGISDALVLRDFHVDNLMLLEGRSDIKACGLLDFQDAVLGCAQYDLVSILQDARRDLPEGLEETLLTQYLTHRPELDTSLFMKRYWILAAQRHARIAGVFIRLMKRDGKDNYLAFMPRVLKQLKTALNRAGFVELESFLQAELGEWWQWLPATELTSTTGDHNV